MGAPDFHTCPTPCFVVDAAALRRNLGILAEVMDRSGARILAALKGFAMWRVFPMMRETLCGVCASGPHEARLGREAFGRSVHTYAPAFKAADVDELLETSDALIFNSFGQFERFGPRAAAAGLEVGLRINPRYSEVEVELYNPCAPGSRLGIPRERFEGRSLDGVDGLHFHTMCELERVEEQFGEFFGGLKWINFGGGHHITRPDYDVDRLVEIIREFRGRWEHLDVYLEPGEAVALNAGYLASTVLDVVPAETPAAILDTSAAAHMPDVLEMPYRPEVIGAAGPGEKAHTYRLGGLTCLAGDVIGDYSFPEPLEVGSRVVFTDMAHYTMVKTNTFNGVRLPTVALWHAERDEMEIVREFGYAEYKRRLS